MSPNQAPFKHSGIFEPPCNFAPLSQLILVPVAFLLGFIFQTSVIFLLLFSVLHFSKCGISVSVMEPRAAVGH